MRLLIPVLFLASCAPYGWHAAAQNVAPADTVRIEKEVVYRPYPVDIEAPAGSCMAQPAAPEQLSNKNMGVYIAALVQAGADCRAKEESRK